MAKQARRHECKACNAVRLAEHHHRTKDRRLQQAKARYHANPSAVWTPERRARANELAIQRNQILRDGIYKRYGSMCQCCGETETKFLTVDHVENNGSTMRKVHGTGASFYRWLEKHKPESGFQLLCMNCNFGKARNGGICPHNEGSTTIPKGSTAK